MYPGTFPKIWVVPSGIEEDEHPSTSNSMLSSIHVLDSAWTVSCNLMHV